MNSDEVLYISYILRRKLHISFDIVEIIEPSSCTSISQGVRSIGICAYYRRNSLISKSRLISCFILDEIYHLVMQLCSYNIFPSLVLFHHLNSAKFFNRFIIRSRVRISGAFLWSVAYLFTALYISY
jgi:hypothetical protein